jgi:hypothetical protein
MKVLAIMTLKPEASLESVRAELANEIRGAWSLFSSGVLRETYATEIPSRVVFVIETDNRAAAEHHLARLPLIGQFRLTDSRRRNDRGNDHPGPASPWIRVFCSASSNLPRRIA